ncbi:methyltransferase domain-containing protein [Leucobacter chromiiresistens]|uniref:23S rRNA m(5)U-747 methyltransferase n=1 Tax=Leucobacter chromiiresistens TaxID=1079994 RepID=A0A1H1ABV2_9MICO|nr:methyltransferase domain-containing protein [Leucobacter chromiiresistens]SDQ37163.1 23S rRNA m(5)U-747 methyltransferase [Leucobacter chromiiresistens]
MPTSTLPHCAYFEAGRCRSCVLLETPYPEQLGEKERRCRDLLPQVPEALWLPTVRGGTADFRNKAKLVVGGRPGAVTLGILDRGGAGVDLRDCVIQEPGIRDAIPQLAAFIESTALAPYDVPRRRGELKFVHITLAPSGDLMLRFVTRSEQGLHVLRKALPALLQRVPRAVVVSVNLLPEHKAVLEGEREELLLGSSLEMGLGDISLHLRPQSFFQTNTAVARALYAQAAEWVTAERPDSIWDLYCGVGGFALHCAVAVRAEPPRVLGVEISAAAVESARRSASEAGIAAEFVAADATAFALAAPAADAPHTVIVNPPRRGIGAELSAWIERAPAQRVIYSSCNPESLATDLAAMPSWRVRGARVFDMFPHTRHLEVMVLLERHG